MHRHVPNCIIHPLPDMDPAGHALRELDAAVTALARISETQPQRLLGDACLVDSALIQLQLIRQRIDVRALQAAE